MTRRYDAIVFDLDGTLIDSAPGLRRAAAAMLAERDLRQPDLETVIGFIGQGAPKLVERCLTWAGADPDPAALDRFLALYGADPMSGTTVYPGAQRLLEDLRERGIALGLCTNKPEAPTLAILEALSLGPFDTVIGGDTLPVRKPDPRPLLTVIERLKTTPDRVLYVGDSITDWRTAQAATVAYAHIAGGYERRVIHDFHPAFQLPSLNCFIETVFPN